MEIIKSLTGSTSVSDVQVQKPISHILVTKTGTGNAIVNEVISAVLKTASNEQVVIPISKIRDIAIISQFENGYMLQQLLADASVECAFILELSTGTALQLLNNDYLSIDLDKLEAGATYSVHGLEVLEEARTYIKYTTTQIVGTESQQKQYSLGDNSVSLAIRNNGSLKKIRLFGYNGKEVAYTPVELSAIAREINGMTIGPDKLIEGDAVNQAYSGGAAEFFWLPTTAYKGFEITTEGGVDLTFFTVNNMAY
ncbi:hypothetical protein DBR40_19925 [Pedobacter sp. KBW01]|uniref:hypothetical protein n=1 Tax=Pedobacter sp. KBW01 TaxID=2153364 RepID=UPI000F59FC11|nr:hypothetical protein [Pedobacter sp. KBW01]RQO68512.1 hypothetical protein DBR40_19925 [Pedobacter sp. KBW01]